MERITHPNKKVCAASIIALLIATGAAAAVPQRLLPQYQPAPTTIITPQQDSVAIPEDYHNNKPQPLIRGEGFNYNLYYNYRLTPHLILRPNLQQTMKPGAVNDGSQLFVGGLSAGINF